MAHCCVQILKPNPCLSLSNLCTSSLHLMKPTRQTCSTAYRDQNPGTRPLMAAAHAITRRQWLLEFLHTPPQILDSQLGYQSHAPPRQPCCPSIHLTWEFGNHTTPHAPTHTAWVSVFSSTRRWTSHTPARRRKLLLMSSDITGWCHHSMSAAMQAPPHQP